MSHHRAVFGSAARVAALVAALVAAALVAACAARTGQPAASSPAAAIDPNVEAVRRQVVNGSIIADAQLGRMPPMAVGACVDPVAAARSELDRSLDVPPDQPPVAPPGFALPSLPESMRDSEVRTGVVMARWVVDTNGTAIPGTVAIVSSPHGLMSVQVCGAILTTRFTPAKDNGRVVRARVDMPIRFTR
jgi:hypothetical protein